MITFIECNTGYRPFPCNLRVELPQWQQGTVLLVQVTSVLPVFEIVHNVKAIVLVDHSLHDFKCIAEWLTLHDHCYTALCVGLGQLAGIHTVTVVILLRGTCEIVSTIPSQITTHRTIGIARVCITRVCICRCLGAHAWIHATGSMGHGWFFTCRPFTLHPIGHVGIINTSCRGHPTKAHRRRRVGEDGFLLNGVIHRLTASSAVVELIFQYFGGHTFLYQVRVKLCFCG